MSETPAENAVTCRMDTAGERLDRFLARMQPELTRSHIQKLIASGDVRVDGRAQKPGYKSRGGETVTLVPPAPEATEVLPEDLPLDILYDDEDIIVVNQARGMVVHPAAGVTHGTLVNALLYHCKDLSGINGEIRPGIVHRLDKDTSGVMVCAKNDRAHVSLAEQIKEKTATRTYIAIVHGNITEEAGTIKGAIGRHPTERKQMAIVEGGKPAVTHFRILERYGKYTLVECRLETGRTHQIRVHMTSIGHPLVGDPKYGNRKNPFQIAGQALHSKSLDLTHPKTGERMHFEAAVPEDMMEIISSLRREQSKV